MEKRSSIIGRCRRYVRVSSSISKVTIHFIKKSFVNSSASKSSSAQVIATALGSLKGPIMKVAQTLATVPDAIPEEYAREFLKLQTQAPSMGGTFIDRRMIAELGQDWRMKFKNFDRESIAAASIGQVHRAISLTDEHLACKLQYPNMESIVEADLEQLRMALAVYERYVKALVLDQVFQELASHLREELDYTLEANNIRLYQEILKDMDDVHVPKIFQELSTKRLLTMSWLGGTNLRSFLNKPQDFRNNVIKKLFRTWYGPFYRFAIIHGDPHLGNYTVQDDGSINLLDFGCVRKFDPSFIQGVIDLYNALKSNDEDLAVHAYETWGFRDLSRDIVNTLNLWAGLLYEPLIDNRVRPIQAENRGIYGRNLAYRVHSELRRLGGVRPPREFVFMDRVAVGVGSACMHLRAELNWHHLYEDIIKEFNVEQVKIRQKRVLERSNQL